MNYLNLIGTVFILNLLGAMSPGPDFVMAVRNSLNFSRKIGIYTGIGISLGLTVHIFYCSVGIAFIISKSIVVFTIIKYIGAAYLAYMGVISILMNKSKINIENGKQSADMSVFMALKTGFLSNVLNPKATLFFLGLFTFVINQDTPVYVILIISVMMIITGILWFILVAVFFTQTRIKNTFLKFERWINLLFGLLLIFLAVKIGLMQR